MQNVEEQIEAYATLDADERDAVVAFVSEHPEWVGALAKAQEVAAVFDEVQTFLHAPLSDEALVHYLLTRAYTHALPPAHVQAWMQDVKQALESDAAVQARYERLQSRLAALEHIGTLEHFEQVTGHGVPGATEATTEAPLLSGQVEAGYRRLAEPSRVHVLRPFLMAAAVVLIALYGVLFWAGDAFRSRPERLAQLSSAEAAWSAPVVRGHASAGAMAQQVERAVHMLAASPASTLGLFPHYKTAHVRSALTLLDQALAGNTDAPPTPLELEALYFKGKAHLALQETAKARFAFRQVVRWEGPSASAAERLLERMAGL